MPRTFRALLLAALLLVVLPGAARAATVTANPLGDTIQFDAGNGEANTAVIAKQGPGVYYVGDQNPAVTVTSATCVPATSPLPPGVVCTVPGVTHLVENLGDKNDTGVIGDTTGGPAGAINGGAGDDTLVGGQENDTFHGDGGTDTVAYAGIPAASITRTTGVTATLPTGTSSASNGQAGENDTIFNDVEGLVGGNGNDTLTGNDNPNTIVGAAPVGTPGGVTTSPAGVDTIDGQGGADSLVAGDSGSVTGGLGNDSIVGGRNNGVTTVLHGGQGDDTIVSGRGDDDIFGDGGANTLAYASVSQGALKIVDRGGTGVTAVLPGTGGTTTHNGRSGENDTIHDDVQTLIGSNGNDTLTGSARPDTIVGAAPVGTPGGVTTSPAGSDVIDGMGNDDTLVGGDAGSVTGGPGNDNLVGGRSTSATTVIHGGDGNDTIVSGPGNDSVFGDAGANTLAYASVVQAGLNIVNRGTAGVTATLASPGQTTSGGRTGGAEHDTIHPGIGTLVGSNGNDVLTGSSGNDTIVGVAPAGTPGVAPGPPGNDTLNGAAGVDLLLGAAGDDHLNGGPGADAFVAGAGNDTLLSRDGTVEAPSCGSGVDTVTADPTDKPAADCEHVDTGVVTPPVVKPPVTKPPAKDKTKPRITQRSAILVLGAGRRVSFYLACRNEKKGCRGTFVIRTRAKVRVGRHKAKRYTLGHVAFRIAGRKPKRYRVKLSATTLKLVRRHHSLKLTGTATARDSSGNKAKKSFRLVLRRR